MNWPSIPIKEVAPAEAASIHFSANDAVWHLTLDQIESNTGTIINKRVGPASEAGSSSYIFDDGNVLYSKLRPYLNKVICPSEAGIATTELVPLRPYPNVLDRKFLTYYLRSTHFLNFANVAVAGVKMPRLIMSKFWKHQIPLPPLSEQQRIVKILDQADAIRQQRRAADEKAARILPALFYKMFGDPITNPLGLPKKKLGDLIKVKSGNFLPAKNMDDSGNFPVYGGNGINGCHSEYMFEEPVIVIGRVGIYCGAVHFSQPYCWVTDNALYVAEHSEDLYPRYIAEALRIANLNQYAGRAGQPLISGNRIYPVEILVPSPDKQKKFGKYVEYIEQDIRQRENSGCKIDTLFEVLLHRAFTGDLTAKWREKHKEKLEAEMQEQMTALEKAQASKPKRGRRRKAAK